MEDKNWERDWKTFGLDMFGLTVYARSLRHVIKLEIKFKIKYSPIEIFFSDPLSISPSYYFKHQEKIKSENKGFMKRALNKDKINLSKFHTFIFLTKRKPAVLML